MPGMYPFSLGYSSEGVVFFQNTCSLFNRLIHVTFWRTKCVHLQDTFWTFFWSFFGHFFGRFFGHFLVLFLDVFWTFFWTFFGPLFGHFWGPHFSVFLKIHAYFGILIPLFGSFFDPKNVLKNDSKNDLKMSQKMTQKMTQKTAHFQSQNLNKNRRHFWLDLT